MIPFLLFTALILCSISMYRLDWKLTTTIPLTVAAACTFASSLAWRATPRGSARNLNGALFLAAAVLSILLINEPSLIRSLWPYMTILVFTGIHIYLFDVSRKSFLFSGVRVILLLLPMILNTIVVAGLFLWNGGLTLATVGFLVAVIFALLAILLGYERSTSRSGGENSREEIR